MWGLGTVTRGLNHPTGIATIDADSLYVLEFSGNAVRRVTLSLVQSETIEHFMEVAGAAAVAASGGALSFPVYCALGGASLYVSNWGERSFTSCISIFGALYIQGEDAKDSQDEAGSYDEYYFGTQPMDPNIHFVVGPRGLALRGGLLYVWEDEYNYFGARGVPALVTYSGTAKSAYVIGFSGSAFNPPADVYGHMQGLRLSADGDYLVWTGSAAVWRRMSLASGEVEQLGGTGYGVASSDNGWYYKVDQNGTVQRWHPTFGLETIISNLNARHLFDIDAAPDGTLYTTSSDTPDSGAGGFNSVFTAGADGRNELLHLRPQPPGEPVEIDPVASSAGAVANLRHTQVHDAEFGVTSIHMGRGALPLLDADPDGTFDASSAPASCIEVALLANAPALGAWT